MMVPIVSKLFVKIFGSRNDRLLKTYRRHAQQINGHEAAVRQLTDVQLREKTQAFRAHIDGGGRMDDIVHEALAIAREAMDRSVGIRNILNPEAGFDPSALSEQARELYERVRGQAAKLDPQPVPGQEEPVPGWMQVDIPIELYHAVRDLYVESRPPFRARPFDVQLIGGLVLSGGKIAEMKTGEGKTIVAPLACYLVCLERLQAHVVTVNDYLVQRDRDWVFPFYYHLGLTVGAIHPTHMQSPQLKQQAYLCDVVYGTNSEFGFDYLRDNMKLTTAEQVQKRRDFAIYDEVDSILIDEARTPLIISGPAHDDAPRYALADQVARHLVQKQREWDAANAKVQAAIREIKGLEGDIRNSRDKAKAADMRERMKQIQQEVPQLEAQRDQHTQYYEVEREKKASHLTHEGVAEAQKVANIGSFYVGGNVDFPHLLENALRAHAVYQRDRDYVVQGGEVIIVDEFTGRLMVGRQWSDGLHQAVESKEHVKIKQETQTLATITIQNFAKLYSRLAGMTGTAVTEATEFDEIYDLDVVCIPTNKPVIRDDRNDLIFLSAKDKWTAILDEIKRYHDVGRPVLVGTTSVENSEVLSQMLTKRYAIPHEVLNAKQHEREAAIVENAGSLGAVMIATNMAGRGTDIKLRRIDRAALVRHWQQRNLLPKQATPDMDDTQLIELTYRHMGATVLGRRAKEIADAPTDALHLDLLRHWVAIETFVKPDKASNMSVDQCLAELDTLPDFMLHRLRIFSHVEQMGGLHIVGTERHESRRIDNQLRGRAGRQGDQGSSRFFISMEDDLMKLFAGKATLTALSKLGMKEGDAIEHRWVTRSVERAQKKVEERNFQIRKNLLEYDEVMEVQRNAFYGIRQQVLEGRGVEEIIFDYIADAVDDAVDTYLADDYVQTQMAEAARQIVDVGIDPSKLRADELDQIERVIRDEARAEAAQTVEITLGEYMSEDAPPEEWDLRGLSSWAMSRFSVDLPQSRLRKMSPREVADQLTEAARNFIDRKDLSPLSRFLDPHYGPKQLAAWAEHKFTIRLDVDQIAGMPPDAITQYLLDKARHAYVEREIIYPIDFALEMTASQAQQDQAQAGEQLVRWVKHRFGLEWTAEQIFSQPLADLRQKLVIEARQWIQGDKLTQLIDDALALHDEDDVALAEWAQSRFGQRLTGEELAAAEDRKALLLDRGRAMLRAELTQLERFVLLQILDMAWKDHLYAMDQLKDSVGLRGYAERDPRIEYKREGAGLFRTMQQTVRDRVTNLIFRARLTAQAPQARSVYGQQQARHDEAGSVTSQAATAAAAGSADQRADLEAANHAGAHDEQRFASRHQRRAAQARAKKERAHPVKQRKRR